MQRLSSILHRFATVSVASLLATLLVVSASRAQTTKIPLNLGIIKIASMTDVYAAQKLGYFADQGLDVNFSYATNGQVLLEGLQAGSLDIALAIPGTAMQARDHTGMKLVLVMQNEIAHAQPPDQGALMVSADSPITSVKGLAGKKIGYAQISNQQWAGVHDVLSRNGVDPKSTQEIEIPFPQMPSALDRGLVDAVAALEPSVSMMLNAKKARVLSWNYVSSVPSQPVGAFWTTDTWSANNSATMKKFTAAMHTSVTYLNLHPAVRTQMVEEFTGMQPEMVANLIPNLWSDHVVRADWEKTLQLMVRTGLVSSNLKLTDLVPLSETEPNR
jgi:NitT/TauT family transport system substrate-binding protein